MLGYISSVQHRALRAFARHLDRAGHRGPIPLEASLDWASATTSPDPCNPARRLGMVRGFLRHLSAIDSGTEVPAPGLLGPAGHRTPPDVYSDQEIAELLQAATGLPPAGGLRPHCYAVLLGLIACTGLRISEAPDCPRRQTPGGRAHALTITSVADVRTPNVGHSLGVSPAVEV